jgi:hypothetical protein
MLPCCVTNSISPSAPLPLLQDLLGEMEFKLGELLTAKNKQISGALTARGKPAGQVGRALLGEAPRCVHTGRESYISSCKEHDRMSALAPTQHGCWLLGATRCQHT